MVNSWMSQSVCFLFTLPNECSLLVKFAVAGFLPHIMFKFILKLSIHLPEIKAYFAVGVR